MVHTLTLSLPCPLNYRGQRLKLDILRVQNSHAEISLVASELRKQVEQLRGFTQKLQAAENGALQYGTPRAAGVETLRQSQQSHASILKEIAIQCEARLQEYDAHIQELYHKVVASRTVGGSDGFGGLSREFTPDQLATLIRLQNDALLKVAAQVAVVHEMVERLRSEWNSRTGQDPFQEMDRLAAQNEERKRKTNRLMIRSPQEQLRQSIGLSQTSIAPSFTSPPLAQPASNTSAGFSSFLPSTSASNTM
ncbi:hypothetical protein Naga_100004g159 [Nannochloropsis gaditana]|uniref:Uncharacterized protein n=1 Tax=Nannochloropsis gaditana TaxID=72520 RepID=W7U5Z1_9STRA|nr:hypothetical protein Naga_100004g159 [Nannochloropsis gaditana]